jgi:glycosyltransferase involved in cell wall biosynthesis
MPTCPPSTPTIAKQTLLSGESASFAGRGVSLLTGGFDKPYTTGLAMALSAQGVPLEIIGSDDIDSPEMHSTPGLTFLNLRGSKAEGPFAQKAIRSLTYYIRLIRYAVTARPKIFHILWNNKFDLFDRTILMLYYRLLGKRIVLTAHNVNAGIRDANDSLLNRITLRAQYRLADHILVHTELMKQELIQGYQVPAQAVTVIPFGINDSVPDTALTRSEAKQLLGILDDEKVILFFGAIRPYKGLEYLVDAFQQLAAEEGSSYRLIIAGKPRKDCEKYWNDIFQKIHAEIPQGRVIQAVRYISDEETELYFKASDVVALPYTHIFQSGVMFLAYNFGLPVIATQTGSFSEEILEGSTGFLCKPRDSYSLRLAIQRYFESDLFRDLALRRKEIRDYASAKHSWQIVGEITRAVYSDLLHGNQR